MKEYIKNIAEGLKILEPKYGMTKSMELYNNHRLTFRNENRDLFNGLETILDYEVTFSNDFLKYAKEVLGND